MKKLLEQEFEHFGRYLSRHRGPEEGYVQRLWVEDARKQASNL